MNNPRSKTYLTSALEAFVKGQLNGTWPLKGVQIEVIGRGSNWFTISVLDIAESNTPRVYEIRVIQKA